MKDIPEEWVQMAMRAYWDAPGHTKSGVAAAIAAVAPLIAAAEREACAKVADGIAHLHEYKTGRQWECPTYLEKCDAKEEVANDIAAAIRARSDAP